MRFIHISPCGLIFIYGYCAAECFKRGILTEILGHRCAVDNETIIGSESGDPHICNGGCLHRQNCQFLNYNMVERRCIYGQGPCIRSVPDDNSYLVYFGTKSEFCLRWVPKPANSTGTLIRQCKPGQCPYASYVGRIATPNHVLPGVLYDGKVYTVVDGLTNANDIYEILDVMYGCDVAWRPFKAGDAIPREAVVGGYLTRGGRTPVYVIRGTFGNEKGAGYYDPKSKTGYADNFGVKQFREMDMLVLI